MRVECCISLDRCSRLDEHISMELTLAWSSGVRMMLCNRRRCFIKWGLQTSALESDVFAVQDQPAKASEGKLSNFLATSSGPASKYPSSCTRQLPTSPTQTVERTPAIFQCAPYHWIEVAMPGGSMFWKT